MFRKLHPAMQLIVMLCLTFVCGTIVMAVSFVLAAPVWGLNAVTTYNVTNTQTPIGLHYFMQTVSQVGVFLVPAFLFASMLWGSTKNFKFTFSKAHIMPLVWIFLTLLALQPLLTALANWNLQLHLPESLQHIENSWREKEDMAISFFKMLLSGTTIQWLLISLFVVAVVPAVCEELIFRGILQQFIRKLLPNNLHLTVWITAIVFTFIHFQMFSFIPRLVLGLLLGYVFEYSKSIIVSIIIHFINNSLTVVSMFLYNNGYEFFNPDGDIEYPGNTFIWIAGSIILSGAFIYMFYHSKKRIYNTSYTIDNNISEDDNNL